jgi:hypothetical protein
MAYEQKPNSGTLFKNDRKTATNHPDYQGTWKDENGKEWSFAAWVKDGKKGKFFSVSASEKRSSSANKNDDLPF